MREDATESLRQWDARRCVVAVWASGSTLRPLPDEGTLVIGRGAECDVIIDDRSVSRMHAALHVRADRGTFTIEDLGSSNGTRVRGRPLRAREAMPVTPHDIVEVGGARILLEAAPMGQGDAGTNTAMEHVKRLVELVATSEICVVVCGETGVGKELTAETIHRLSPRAGKPMVRINCAALSDTLIESELFGHERGAFTGALQAKPGLLEAAHGGTFLLDEVGEMALPTQAKLLRVLESREVVRVGGVTPRQLDVRFIAATNRDLRALCEANAFRSDLYFRLNGMTIIIPPLRERKGEIPSLAAQMIAQRSTRHVLTPDAIGHLMGHDWPGNVRELRNVIERALVLASNGVIGPEHLPLDPAPRAPEPPAAPPPSSASAPPASLKEHVAALERERITEALARCGGNQSKAARILGMSRKTLLARLDAWGLPRPRK